MAEEAAHFYHEHVLHFLDAGRAANHSRKMLPVGTEAIAVWYQHQSLVISYELSTHLESRSVGIDGTFLAQFLHNIGRVDDYQMFPKSGGRAYGAYLTYQHISTVVIMAMAYRIFYPTRNKLTTRLWLAYRRHSNTNVALNSKNRLDVT